MIRKVLDELRLEKKEEKEWKLKFLTAKNRLFKNLSDYEEEKKSNRNDKKNHERNRHSPETFGEGNPHLEP